MTRENQARFDWSTAWADLVTNPCQETFDAWTSANVRAYLEGACNHIEMLNAAGHGREVMDARTKP